MKPTYFPERNCNLESTGKEPIPAFKNQSPNGEIVIAWKLNLVERLQVLFTGRIWACQITKNTPYRPTLLTTDKDVVFYTEKGPLKEDLSAQLDRIEAKSNLKKVV